MQSKKILFIILTILFLSATALPARAAILPDCAKDVNAVLQLSCFMDLLIGVSQWILGITGSLALLFFIYGGFLFLTSAGNEKRITDGKTVLTQATIGIIIIFGAYIAINFLVANVLKTKFSTEIPQEATGEKTGTLPTITSIGTCYCSFENINIQTKTLETKTDLLQDYPTSEACAAACNTKCKATKIPTAPGNYDSGQCQSSK